MERILVIEPDDRVAALVGTALAERGYVVDRIDRGTRAADLAVAGDYVLVLLELMLPDLDGREVLRQVCRQRPDRRVFVVSSRDTVAERVECLEEGAVDFMGKPFDIAELLVRVEVRVTEGRPRPRGQRLSSHNLSLDPTTRKVRRGGRWIGLTDVEYRVLAHLIDNGARTCSRDELLNVVWGLDDDSSSRYVEMYVSKLRSKLGRDAIRTVRGAGYCVNGSSLGRPSSPFAS